MQVKSTRQRTARPEDAVHDGTVYSTVDDDPTHVSIYSDANASLLARGQIRKIKTRVDARA
jgi:hypothetical protein